MEVLPVAFIGGSTGTWQVRHISTIAGEPLAPVPRVDVREGTGGPVTATWVLRGIVGHARYAEAAEQTEIGARSPGLGRPEASAAALIPVRKSDAWWSLAQDERRGIIERSAHFSTGTDYLPAVARRLHHSRDLGEPFDFLTWFEFAPADEARFDELVTTLRSTEEWTYVDREVDIRLLR